MRESQLPNHEFLESGAFVRWRRCLEFLQASHRPYSDAILLADRTRRLVPANLAGMPDQRCCATRLDRKPRHVSLSERRLTHAVEARAFNPDRQTYKMQRALGLRPIV